MATLELMTHPWFVRLKPVVPAFVWVTTVGTFLLDLYVPLGFAPWVFYFFLAFVVSRFYPSRVLLLSTVLWSVLVLSGAVLLAKAGDPTAGVFNRAVGVGTLWLMAGLLYLDSRSLRARLEAELRIHAIVEGALDAVVTMDERGLVVEWNPQAEVTFGFTRAEAVGVTLAELIIPPQYRAAHAAGLQRYLKTGQESILRRRIEITALRKNGEEFPVELTVTPLRLGEHMFFSSFIRDISERKRGEDALRQTTSFIESMFEHLPNMVFVKDAKNLRFVRLNKAGEELLGYSQSDLLGKNDYDFFSKEEADFFTAKDRETLSGHILVNIPEETIQSRTRGLRLLHTKKIPICDSLGTSQYLLGISEDITESKETEVALVKARLAAEEASQAKSDFLANMSHEMRTPLNAIIGLTDFLLRTPLSSDQADLLKRCEKAGSGLLRMIEDLLQAAKVDSGTLELVQEPFALRELVEDTVGLLTQKAQAKGLSLSLSTDPGLPALVLGDALRLQQVLLNLIGNAVKFTAEGGVEVRVELVPGDADAGAVRFVVADTGIGIPPEQQGKIFDRFLQVDSRASRSYGGVGLGLAICQQLVGLMGGRILVESKPAQGSIFTVIVRFEAVSENQPQRVLSERETLPVQMAEAGAQVPGERGLKILLAEDCAESQDLMALYLRGTPHRMDRAASGANVVERYQTGGYDLVFMDLQMPGMDGYAATRAIRAWEETQGLPRVPIVALTANADGEAQRNSLLAGCTDFVTKPVKVATILGVIQRYMDAPKKETVSGPSEGQRAVKEDTLEQSLQALRPKFLRNRQQDVTILQSAIVAQNADTIRTIGHRIKGLAGSYGLDRIGLIGSALEVAALDRDFERVTVEVQRLVAALREAEGACSEAGDGIFHSQY
ncbi:MAG: PAS domain S-box protein [Nitrospirota bacterium]|nr:PAS domain S-box protein [Nitrospirota bacterium]